MNSVGRWQDSDFRGQGTNTRTRVFKKSACREADNYTTHSKKQRESELVEMRGGQEAGDSYIQAPLFIFHQKSFAEEKR